MKERSECKIYAYCLMNNHVHLLIQKEKNLLVMDEKARDRVCQLV